MQTAQLIGGFFLFFSFGSQAQHDLKIPDHVLNYKTESYQQFPGTRVFAEVPASYQIERQYIRFKKNERTFLKIIEIPASDFAATKARMNTRLREIIKGRKLPTVYYKKEFRLDKYDAKIYYGADSMPDVENIILCFGNQEFTVIAFAEFVVNDKSSREEVLKVLLSLYVDEKIKADCAALATCLLNFSSNERKRVN